MTLFSSFDESEFADKVEEIESDPIEELAQEDEVLDEEMNEAEQRINLAGYYRTLARGGIFKDGSEEARIVDAEVRQFARERMAVLLNLPSAPKPKVELPFSTEQISALQQWANRIIEKQNSLGAPQLASPRPPQLPTVAPQTLPAPTITTLTPPPTTRKETPKRKPKATQKSVAKKEPVPATPEEMSEAEQEAVPDGVLFQVGNNQYKWIRNGDGRRLKVRQTRGQIGGGAHQRIPMPSAHAMAAISAAKAHDDLATTPAATNEKIQAAAALSIIKKD